MVHVNGGKRQRADTQQSPHKSRTQQHANAVDIVIDARNDRATGVGKIVIALQAAQMRQHAVLEVVLHTAAGYEEREPRTCAYHHRDGGECDDQPDVVFEGIRIERTLGCEDVDSVGDVTGNGEGHPQRSR